MKIAVLGLGHVGLPTALGFAELGWDVVGADDDREKAARIAAGRLPFFEPDRIVLGVESERSRELLLEVFRPLLNGFSNDKLILTDLNTAEIIKHASNAFLATKVSFINLMADFCEASGADVGLVAKGM